MRVGSATRAWAALHGGREQRLLDGVLAGVETPVATDQRTEDPRRKLAQQSLDPGILGVGARTRVQALIVTTSGARPHANGSPPPAPPGS
jgi:hypothetical protein